MLQVLGLVPCAILVQEFEDGEHVIAYHSRSLKGREKTYAATELECLAVLHALEAFRPYIDCYNFEVVIDHSSLQWLCRMKNPTGRLARWAVQHQQYNMTIVHRKGSSMQAPDALLRNPMPDPDDLDLDVDKKIEDVPEVGLVELPPPADITDEWYSGLLKKVSEDPDSFEKFKIHEGHLYKLIIISPYLPLRWVQEGREQLLYQCHNDPTSGHGGWFRTFSRLRVRGLVKILPVVLVLFTVSTSAGMINEAILRKLTEFPQAVFSLCVICGCD